MSVDMSQYVEAKSDQLNADDLLGGPITVRVTAVRGMNDKEQPIAISYDGDHGKPYKPGKSMRRVLLNFWGKDGQAYVGRWMTLYRDPEVTFGKIKVGGIRISHMSHIDGGEMALAVTKGAKRLYKVKSLQPPEQTNGGGEQRQKQPIGERVGEYIAAIRTLDSALDVAEYQADERRAKWVATLRTKFPDEAARIDDAVADHLAALAGDAGGGDDTGGEVEGGRTDEQHDDADDDNDDGFPGDPS